MDNNNSLNHLAIIMDGNGRWALNQDLPRTAGHAAGELSLIHISEPTRPY